MQVVSAAAALSDTSSASSQETQANLLVLARTAIQSAQMSYVSMSSDQAGQIVAIAAIGTGSSSSSNNKMSTSTKTSSKANSSKRLLLSAREPSAVALEAAAGSTGRPGWLGSMRHLLSASLPFRRPGRHLQQDSTGTSTATTVSSIKGAALKSTLDAIAELLAGSATPATGYVSTGAKGMYVSVANMVGSSYATENLAVGDMLEATGGGTAGGNKAASSTAPSNVLVEFTSPLLGVCDESDDPAALLTVSGAQGCVDGIVSVVIQYFQDPTLLVNEEAAGGVASSSDSGNITVDNNSTFIEGSASGSDDSHIVAESGSSAVTAAELAAAQLLDLELLSGAVVLSVAGALTDAGGMPCSNSSSSSDSSSSSNNGLPSDCGALLTLPFTGAVSRNDSKQLVAIRVDSSGTPLPLTATTLEAVIVSVANSSTAADGSGRRLLQSASGSAQIWVSRSGTYVVGQVSMTRSAPLVNTTADNTTSGGNDTLPTNGNETLPTNSTDINATTTVNTTIDNSNATASLNTTQDDTSPVPTNFSSPAPLNSTSTPSPAPVNTTNTTLGEVLGPAPSNTTNATSPTPTSNTTSMNQTNQQPPAPASPSPSPVAQQPSPSPTPSQGAGATTSSDSALSLNVTFPLEVRGHAYWAVWPPPKPGHGKHERKGSLWGRTYSKKSLHQLLSSNNCAKLDCQCCSCNANRTSILCMPAKTVLLCLLCLRCLTPCTAVLLFEHPKQADSFQGCCGCKQCEVPGG